MSKNGQCLWQCWSDHLIFLCYRLRADCQCWQTVFQHVLLRVVNLSGNTRSIQNEELPDFYAFYWYKLVAEIDTGKTCEALQYEALVFSPSSTRLKEGLELKAGQVACNHRWGFHPARRKNCGPKHPKYPKSGNCSGLAKSKLMTGEVAKGVLTLRNTKNISSLGSVIIVILIITPFWL